MICIKYYYVFICLDNVPILELFLDKRFQSIDDYEKIEWENLKYIILNFKTSTESKETVQKGQICYKNKILTKQITYFSINLSNVYNILSKNKIEKLTKSQKNIIVLAEKLFFSESIEFLDYLKATKILPKHDIQNFEKAFERIKIEKQIINSWKNCKKSNQVK